MKNKLVRVAIASAFIVCIRLLPCFSFIWIKCISFPALRLLSSIGSRFSFVLLEFIIPGILLFFGITLFSKRIRRFTAWIMFFLAASFFSIWYPLYFQDAHVYAAGPAQLAASCEILIDQLNASVLNFELPDDLPAKFVRFPKWMDALKISGLCSFPTGEALISPDLPSASIPFVAVHERMHLDGHAGEGAANIAAWKECLSRGGVYAESARLWALRYSMGMLKTSSPERYQQNLACMNSSTLQRYHEAGGDYTPPPLPDIQTMLLRLLGIEKQIQDYEIIALYLAARFPQ